MKIQDIITENQANVREGRLNEFAPGGSEGNGPFEYGTAIIPIGEDFVDTYSDEGAGADAAAIIKVGRKFMSAGMKAGIRAFYAMDTQLRDHVAEELEDQGFNVRKDIYEPHDKSLPATTLTRPVTDADRDWYLLQDLIKEFGKARQGSVDPKTLEQLRQDFGWSLQMGFEELPKKSIRADFTDFAKSKGVDFTAMAKKYQGFRPADRDIKDRGVSEGRAQPLTVAQLAMISDEALDRAYGYGRSQPGNTFGWQANLKSAAYAKKMIDSGVTDIEAISDAIHKGWNVTAQAFVQNPDQFADTEKLRAAGKLEAKLDQRAKLMRQDYAQLADEEKEKDRVVARALLQALRGD